MQAQAQTTLVDGDVRKVDQVRAGDKSRFNADKIDGAFIVTHIENSK